MKKVLVMLVAASLVATGAFAANLASDNASDVAYAGGWANASNGGSGFTAWSITSDNGTGFAGTFVGDPANGGIVGMSASSWGQYANPDGSGAYVNSDRGFTGGALSVGQTFSFDWGVNWDSNGSGNKGWNLYSGGVGGTQLINVNMGGTGTITIDDGSGAATLFANYGTAVMTINVEQLVGGLRIYATGRDGIEAYDNTFAGVSGVDSFRFYSSNLSNDTGDNRQQYINNLAVVPEPSTIVLGVVGVLGLAIARRRAAK